MFGFGSKAKRRAEEEAEVILLSAKTRAIEIESEAVRKAEEAARIVLLNAEATDSIAKARELESRTLLRDAEDKQRHSEWLVSTAENKAKAKATLIEKEANERLLSAAVAEGDAKARLAGVHKDRERIIAECQAYTDNLERDAKQSLKKLELDIASKKSASVEWSNKLLEIQRQLSIAEEDEGLAQMGFYTPLFNFETSDKFKEKIADNRALQKAMLRAKGETSAIYCKTEWTIRGSAKEGRAMMDRTRKLTARAFNGECDAAISSCSFRNVSTMRERIVRSFTQINELNSVNQTVIVKPFLDLKLEELSLVYEYHRKRQEEKEEQREIKAQMAEERRVIAEHERAIKDAEKEERMFQRALDKAREDIAAMTEEQQSAYRDTITRLENELLEAQQKTERTMSQAEQTKRGHIYVISNIGSFGEGIFKIGMTRRLDPSERIDELSSASVPFIFDVHAMIKADDAPHLEKELHRMFDDRRVNKVNKRKEFFHITLQEVKKAVHMLAGSGVEFIETATAQHWRETRAIEGKGVH